MTDTDRLDALAAAATLRAFIDGRGSIGDREYESLVAAVRRGGREALADAIALTDTEHTWLPEGLDVETAADWLYAALHSKDGAS